MTGFVIRRKTLISMLFIGLTMLGYISYRNLPVELFPNTEFPYLFVRVSSFREVDPRYMESQAVIPIEGAIGTLEGINKIETYINPGSARIYIEYGDRARLKYAFLKLQGKINELRSTIPDDFDMQVIKFDLESISNMLMMLEVRGGGGLDRVRNIVDTKVRSALESIDGISNIEIFGGREKSVEIVLNDETCKAYGVTVSEVQRLIGQNGRNVVFVGQAYGEDRSYFVNVIAEYTDVRDLENIVLRRDGPVYLKDVADVSVGIKERESISRVNGKEAVTIQLFRDAQANMIDVAHEVRPVIERLNGALSSHDVEIAVQVDTAALMEDNINLIIDLARVGILLAVVVLWFFLRNIKLVVIIAVAVPVSVFASFNFFYAFDIPINILTLIGMALAVGMLLDNSVVVLENIYRKLSQGMVCGRAVTEGTAEVWRAIAASTLTTVIVFLPFIFSSEYLIKMIGRNIGVSIISTLFISLAVALLLIPAAVHFFLQRGGGDIPGQFRTVSRNDRLFQVYTLLLKSGLRFPMRTIIGTIALFFASVAICLLLSTGALREEESDELNLYVTMPAGTTLEAADAAIADLEARLEEIEEKQDVISSINKEDAKLTVKLREDFRKIRNRDIGQVKSDIQERIKDYSAAEVSFEQTRQRSRGRRGRGKGLERMFGIGARTESVILKGSDFEKMRNFAEEIRLHLYDLPSVTSSRFSVAEDRPEIHLLSDTALMERLGVSLAGIGAELRTFSGGITSGLKYKQGAEEYDIVIRRGADESKTVEDLQRLLIPGAGGAATSCGSSAASCIHSDFPASTG